VPASGLASLLQSNYEDGREEKMNLVKVGVIFKHSPGLLLVMTDSTYEKLKADMNVYRSSITRPGAIVEIGNFYTANWTSGDYEEDSEEVYLDFGSVSYMHVVKLP
jgi:hypothetical protein